MHLTHERESTLTQPPNMPSLTGGTSSALPPQLQPCAPTSSQPPPTTWDTVMLPNKVLGVGVWFRAACTIPSIVWHVAFPKALQQQLATANNATGTISNSDLEMAGLLLHWLTLKNLADLQHTHVAARCDNSPTVAWTTHLISSKDTVAANFIWALSVCMLACQASPLAPFHLPGEANCMANLASHSFTSSPSNHAFLTHFTSLFPPPQDVSWHLFYHHNSITGKVFSAMQTTMSPLVWWLQTTNKGSIIGTNGSNSYCTILTCSFRASLAMTKYSSYKPSSNGLNKATLATDTKSKLELSRTPLPPLARPLNWMDSTTHSISLAPQPTTLASADNLRPSNAPTPLLDLS